MANYIFISILVVVVLVAIIFSKILKQKQLLVKVKQYEKLLKESRVSRFKYQQTLERNREFIKDIGTANESLRVIKAELESIRSDIRQHLNGVRQEKKKSDNSDLDKRVISQMSTVLGEKLKYLNSRKLDYLKSLGKLKEMEEEKSKLEEAENQACAKWAQEKETVLALWRELNTQFKITNPQKYYR